MSHNQSRKIFQWHVFTSKLFPQWWRMQWENLSGVPDKAFVRSPVCASGSATGVLLPGSVWVALLHVFFIFLWPAGGYPVLSLWRQQRCKKECLPGQAHITLLLVWPTQVPGSRPKSRAENKTFTLLSQNEAIPGGWTQRGVKSCGQLFNLPHVVIATKLEKLT